MSWERKELLRWNKNHFSSLLKRFSYQKLSQTLEWAFKSKVIEGSQKGKNVFFNFWALLIKMYIFEVVIVFSCLVVIQSTRFFTDSTYLLDSSFWWSIFPLNYHNACDHQTFQGGDMLQGALTYIYARHLKWVVLWGHLTNKIHISTCKRGIDTMLDKVLT